MTSLVTRTRLGVHPACTVGQGEKNPRCMYWVTVTQRTRLGYRVYMCFHIHLYVA